MYIKTKRIFIRNSFVVTIVSFPVAAILVIVVVCVCFCHFVLLKSRYKNAIDVSSGSMNLLR